MHYTLLTYECLLTCWAYENCRSYYQAGSSCRNYAELLSVSFKVTKVEYSGSTYWRGAGEAGVVPCRTSDWRCRCLNASSCRLASYQLLSVRAWISGVNAEVWGSVVTGDPELLARASSAPKARSISYASISFYGDQEGQPVEEEVICKKEGKGPVWGTGRGIFGKKLGRRSWMM